FQRRQIGGGIDSRDRVAGRLFHPRNCVHVRHESRQNTVEPPRRQERQDIGEIIVLPSWRYCRLGGSIEGMLNPQRTIDELKELRSLTGDENGAQRVAFTPTWEKSRAWLREKLQGLPL